MTPDFTNYLTMYNTGFTTPSYIPNPVLKRERDLVDDEPEEVRCDASGASDGSSALKSVKTEEMLDRPRGEMSRSAFFDFMALLRDARRDQRSELHGNPHALIERIKGVCLPFQTPQVSGWQLFIDGGDGVRYDFRLTLENYASNCFAKEELGLFYYVQIFERVPGHKNRRNDDGLVILEFDDQCRQGEWNWIAAGVKTSGKESRAYIRAISEALGIERAFLSDTAKVDRFELPLRLMQKIAYGAEAGCYYAQDGFRLLECPEGITTPVTNASGALVTVKQVWAEHVKHVEVLRNTQVCQLYNGLLKERKDLQQRLRELYDRIVPMCGVVSKTTLRLHQLVTRIKQAEYPDPTQRGVDLDFLLMRVLDPAFRNSDYQIKISDAVIDLRENNFLYEASFV